jgi:uncharacterized protein with HEPN domain
VPPRNWRLFIADIVDAVDAVGVYISGLTREEFLVDRLRIDAVIKKLTVIGEAAGRVPRSVVEANPQVPWASMRAMRNVVVHEYFGIDADVLWGTVTEDLPPLLALLAPLLVQQGDQG